MASVPRRRDGPVNAADCCRPNPVCGGSSRSIQFDSDARVRSVWYEAGVFGEVAVGVPTSDLGRFDGGGEVEVVDGVGELDIFHTAGTWTNLSAVSSRAAWTRDLYHSRCCTETCCNDQRAHVSATRLDPAVSGGTCSH